MKLITLTVVEISLALIVQKGCGTIFGKEQDGLQLYLSDLVY